jgi:hypothetical protein
MFSKRRRVVAALVLMAGAAVATWQREPIQAWWHVRQLAQAEENERDAHVERVVALGEAASERLIAALRQHSETACGNVQAALVALVKLWGPEDRRALALLENLRRDFGDLSEPGAACALRVAAVLLAQGEGNAPAAVAAPAGDLIKAAGHAPRLRPEMLQLAAALLERVAPGQWRDPCRAFAAESFADANPETRVAALRLTLCEALRDDDALLARATPLLRDPAAEVRAAALIALGPMPRIVAEEELLPLLHDTDLKVQQLCELALRGRGLQEHHLEMARLISDPRPAARLQVLQHLRTASDVDAGVWLRRLSQDPAAAVRASAVRAASEQRPIDLADRLREMQREDASPTVRELAAHYLTSSPHRLAPVRRTGADVAP